MILIKRKRWKRNINGKDIARSLRKTEKYLFKKLIK